MGRHNVVGHLDHDQSATGTPIFSFHEFEASHIANKIRVRESRSRHLHIAVEKILLAVVAVRERVYAMENENDVLKQVQNGRGIGHGQQSDRPVSLTVEMLIAGVERRREERAFAPLEGLLFASIAPDRCRAAAADDKNHFLKQVLLRFEWFPRRYLADIAIVNSLGALQIEIHTSTAHARPRTQLYFTNILDMERSNCRNSLSVQK